MTEFLKGSVPSKLTDRLYLSNCYAAQQPDAMRALGITAVVSLTPEHFDVAPNGFKHLHLDNVDDGFAVPPGVVDRFLAQMDEWEKSGETVMLHCHAGISRTSCFATAWLMHKRGCTSADDIPLIWDECMAQVAQARPIVRPHHVVRASVLRHFHGLAPRAAEPTGIPCAGPFQ